MAKLTTILEKMEKINANKIITDLTQNTHEDVIDDMAMSKKKDDRIAIAANPNLTDIHFEKLANDKVNGVKQALCYNKSIPSKYAKQLLDEEPLRLEFIASYAGDQIDDTLIDYLTPKAAKDRYSQDAILKWLGVKPTVSTKLYKWVTDNIEMDRIGFSKDFQRRKDAPKEQILLIINKMISNDSNAYGGISRIILNNDKVFDNKTILTLDQSNNGVQEAILFRNKSTKKMVLDVIENMNEHTSARVMEEGKSKWAKDKDVLNAYLKMVVNSPEINSYLINLNVIRNGKLIGLDADLLVQGAKLTAPKVGAGNNNSVNLEAFILNKNYPADAFDFIPLNEHTVQAIVTSPNVPMELIERALEEAESGSESVEQIMWGLASKDIKLSNEFQEKMRAKLRVKSYFYEYIARGEIAEDVVKNPGKYITDFDTEYSSQKSNEIDVILKMAKNSSLSEDQRDTVLKQHKKFASQKGWDTNPIGAIVTQKSNSPKYLEKLLKKDKNNVWKIWSETGSAFFQYSPEQQKIIIKYVLKTTECNDDAYGVFHMQKRSFKEWIDYSRMSSENWESKGIDDSTAIKLLEHLLTIAVDSPKLKEYLVKETFVVDYIDKGTVMSLMYNLTDDIKYLSDKAKDIFLF